MSDNERVSVPYFDRVIGALDGLPDVVSTRESTLRVVPPLGIGSTTYIVQTYRQRDQGDTIFLEVHSEEENVRLVIPPKVAAAIARQRDQITRCWAPLMVRSKAAKATAQDRKDRGEIPFVKKA